MMKSFSEMFCKGSAPGGTLASSLCMQGTHTVLHNAHLMSQVILTGIDSSTGTGPSEVLESPFLEALKTRIDVVLREVV